MSLPCGACVWGPPVSDSNSHTLKPENPSGSFGTNVYIAVMYDIKNAQILQLNTAVPISKFRNTAPIKDLGLAAEEISISQCAMYSHCYLSMQNQFHNLEKFTREIADTTKRNS
jgi:hypothetical protein